MNIVNNSKILSKKYFRYIGFGYIVGNCPSKRTMTVKLVIIVIDHSFQSSRASSHSSSKIPSEDECEILFVGNLLVVRQVLGTIQKPFNEIQRKNTFHIRCLINKLCFMIINGSGCGNMSSTRVVDKLELSIISHKKIL